MILVRTFALGLVACALGACRPAPAPRPAGDLTPEAAGAPVRTLRVVAVLDPPGLKVPGYTRRIGEAVDAASDGLAALLGLRLELLAVVAAAAEGSDRLAAAEGSHPEADLVLRFTMEPLPPRPSMADLVEANYLGRAIVLRSLAPLFSPEAAAELQAAEVVAIQHGIGRVFGALPSCTPGVMASTPAFLHERAPRFNLLNLKLIRTHLSVDLGRGGVPADVARRADTLLAEGAQEVCPAGVAERRHALYAQVLAPPPPADPAEAAGLAALEAGDHEAAFRGCEPAARRAPGGPAGRCAGLAAAETGRGAEAVQYLRAWLASHPDDGDAVLILAREVGRAGDDGAARALLTRFVAAHPDHVHARVNLGVALARLGDLAGARTQWEAALAIDPTNADARDLLAQLPPPKP